MNDTNILTKLGEDQFCRTIAAAERMDFSACPVHKDEETGITIGDIQTLMLSSLYYLVHKKKNNGEVPFKQLLKENVAKALGTSPWAAVAFFGLWVFAQYHRIIQ